MHDRKGLCNPLAIEKNSLDKFYSRIPNTGKEISSWLVERGRKTIPVSWEGKLSTLAEFWKSEEHDCRPTVYLFSELKFTRLYNGSWQFFCSCLL